MAAYHLEALRKQRVLNRIAARIKEEDKTPCQQHHHHHHHSKRSRPASAQASITEEDSKKSKNLTACPPSAPSSGAPDPSPVQKESDQALPPSSLSHVSPNSVNVASPNSSANTANCTPRASAMSNTATSRKSSAMSNTATSRRSSAMSNTATSRRSSAMSNPRVPSRTSMHDSVMESEKILVDHNRCSTCGSICTYATEDCSQCDNEKGSRTKSRASSCHTGSVGTAEKKANAIRKDLNKQECILHNNNLVMGTVSVEQEIEELRSKDPFY